MAVMTFPIAQRVIPRIVAGITYGKGFIKVVPALEGPYNPFGRDFKAGDN